MVDSRLIINAIQLAHTINLIVLSAQANKGSCMAMNCRVQIANGIIKAAHDNNKDSSVQLNIPKKAFVEYCDLLEQMKDFLTGMSKKKPFSKVNIL
jgi:hypothetical protein